MKNSILILYLVFAAACNKAPKTATEQPVNNKTTHEIFSHRGEITDGVIFFSSNNGLTWESKSKGLPLKSRLGLGGIAVSGDKLAIVTKENGVYLFDSENDFWENIHTGKQILENNPGTIAFLKNQIFIGTQKGGVFFTADQGKNWESLNTGLANLTIRRLVGVNNKIYAGINGGLYAFNEPLKKWEHQYGNNKLQVNGVTGFNGNILIATNHGVFSSPENKKEWKQVLDNRSVHNISSDSETIYAMVYNELLASGDNGRTWQNIQKGLPFELYTFNVINTGSAVFAGQWDGVYKKNNNRENWKMYSNGLPPEFAISNMKMYNGTIVVSGNERKLKKGMTTNK